MVEYMPTCTKQTFRARISLNESKILEKNKIESGCCGGGGGGYGGGD